MLYKQKSLSVLISIQNTQRKSERHVEFLDVRSGGT